MNFPGRPKIFCCPGCCACRRAPMPAPPQGGCCSVTWMAGICHPIRPAFVWSSSCARPPRPPPALGEAAGGDAPSPHLAEQLIETPQKGFLDLGRWQRPQGKVPGVEHQAARTLEVAPGLHLAETGKLRRLEEGSRLIASLDEPGQLQRQFRREGKAQQDRRKEAFLQRLVVQPD